MTFEGLSPPYATIVADPPWHYAEINPPNPRIGQRTEYVGGGMAYSSMTLDEINTLPVGELGDDCRIYLWVTNRYVRHAWSILECWGFDPSSRLLVWCKTPRGTMNVTTEFVLIGKRGKPPRMPWHNTTWFDWPLQSVHSRKPDGFYDLVEQWSPGPYVDLFCREPRFGWDSWGKGYES